MENQKTGLELIAAERQRQIEKEGWTPDHDDQHQNGEMARAATVYAGNVPDYDLISDRWPWGKEWWKPSADPVRNLVKAGALIAAEIDRLQRKATEDAKAICPDCDGRGGHARSPIYRGIKICATCLGEGTLPQQNKD